MKAILFNVLCFVVVSTQAQNRWWISLNNRIILQQKNSSDSLIAHLKASSYKASGKLIISYTTGNSDTSWKRTFLLNDASGENISTLYLNRQSGSVSVKLEQLKKIISTNKSLYIYTLSLPKDPSLAARVRVARVLLGKIEWN